MKERKEGVMRSLSDLLGKCVLMRRGRRDNGKGAGEVEDEKLWLSAVGLSG